MESDVAINKPYHFYPSFIKGFDAIIKELQSAEIFTVIPRPTLKPFESKMPLLKNLKWENIIQ